LQSQQGHVVLLLPPLASEAFELGQQVVDERCPVGVLGEQGLETRKEESRTSRARNHAPSQGRQGKSHVEAAAAQHSSSEAR
jgi:hypothetical protein